jgi:hypothetical protein
LIDQLELWRSANVIVGLAGDWHGNGKWAQARIASLGDRGIAAVLHVGDFGIWPGSSGKKYLRRIEAVCSRYGVTIYVTAGNHEDWSRLLTTAPEQRNDIGALLWLTDHVAVFPRDPAGHRFRMGGRSFLSLGGAPSVDYEFRTQGVDWWPGEMVPDRTVRNVAAGGYADIMLTHDAPEAPWQTPAVASICSTNPLGWSTDALAYAAVGRQRLTTAFVGVQPRLLVHGHYHVFDEAILDLPDREHRCRIISLASDESPGNVVLLDLDTLEQM